ncbi:response regulator [Candidatus Poseidonia alphae]|nr:response regulator [Candidatus Poseidonia alphae]MDA8638440.1 response regulator [Candidatus Poseidonia alphae]MDA8759138.1 response regulator [Candidatus Poseidonia alphae]MDA8839223.1 response regulator [Candidatus Poseidonia alphae]MDB2335123.1 response regulator [Candidatus Poseidonia alphae]
MGLVTDVNDDAAPTVLIVDNNPMASMRLTNLFRAKNFNIELCEDGDKAVDEYIRLDPELVVLSLDLPSLDGHLAALEMREHGGEQRIVFVASSRLAELARDASFSAGAVAWLQKPISSEALEASWNSIIGTIPEAPGLEDLDSLYPEDRVKVEADEGALLRELPLPLPDLVLPTLPSAELIMAEVATPAKKKSWKKRAGLLFILLSIGVGAAYYLGYVPV